MGRCLASDFFRSLSVTMILRISSLRIFKLLNISGKRHEQVNHMIDKDGSDMDIESSDSVEDDGDYGGGSIFPILQLCKCPCVGSMNRIRQNPHICASWTDASHVQVWGLISQLKPLVERDSAALHWELLVTDRRKHK
ncbi:glutamate-rich WD repeat-containing protein [Striga asiatica]|uniref:Glutamate-rich WD repeat-containing protein n=1 Tax=Striga asiatica TaxID=4170 RepID=A0A5A7Q938_STRAF|nr:glutamate-rich WD repeat-containing protein [Striga asiatica]